MKKTIKLTESELTKVIQRIIKETMWTSTSTWDNLGKKPSNSQNNEFRNYMEELQELEHRLQSGDISDEDKIHVGNDLVSLYEELMGVTKFDHMDDEYIEEYGHNLTLSEDQLNTLIDYIRQLDSEYDLGFSNFF